MHALLLAIALAAAPQAPLTAPPAPSSGKLRSVSALRRACYGGVTAKLRSGVVDEFARMGAEFMLKEKFDLAAHWFERALQGGGEDAGTLRRFGLALEAVHRPEDVPKIEACSDLLQAAYAPPARPAHR
jgi:hypothetical protein